MKKTLVILLVLLFVSAVSNAATFIECKRHEEVKGLLMTNQSDYQLACYNHFRSRIDIKSERIAHPTWEIHSIDDLDPHCYSGLGTSGIVAGGAVGSDIGGGL